MTRRDLLQTWFRPLAVSIMVGSVAMAFVEVIQLIAPTWNGAYVVLACALAALEADHSLRIVRSRRLSQSRLLRFRAVEIAALLILLKAASMIGQPWQAVVADVSSWPNDLSRLLDVETVATSVLLLLAWSSATLTLDDLQRVGEPPALHRESGNPADRVTSRFFYGGIILLMVAGIARIGVAAVMGLERPPVPRLIANVVLYFLVGLALLGQVHLARLAAVWDDQHIAVDRTVITRWARYSLAVIGLATVLAVLLPTGYTVGLLDLGAAAVDTVWRGMFFVFRIIFFVLALVVWLVSTLLSWLMGRDSQAPPPSPDALTPASPDAARTGVPWLDSIKTVVFWVVSVGIVVYVVRSYIRDHPEILRGRLVKQIIGVLSNILESVSRALGRWAYMGRSALPRLLEAVRRRRSARTGQSRLSLPIRRSPRDRVRYYYLSTIERATGLGIPRGRTQTPYEYQAVLAGRLPDAEPMMSELTEAFVEARYSSHTISRRDEEKARVVFAELRRLLRRSREQSTEDSK